MQLFFTPNISSVNTLTPQESHHAVKVLRLKKNDEIHIVDGEGGFFRATVLNADPKACSVTLNEKLAIDRARSYFLHIAMAPTKNMDRFEWFVEKATEIGIDEITPIICEHSERKVMKTDRLERVLIQAMKQSLKAFLPKLSEPVTFSEFLKNQKEKATKGFIAHCHESAKQPLKNLVLESEANITILIGPEGDFSIEEVKTSLDFGYTPVSLGESRLRTETAGIVACHSIYYHFS